MSEYVDQCFIRAMESIDKVKDSGQIPTELEISSDVWSFINMGGINMFPGKKIFAGLNVIEREDLKDYIQAVSNNKEKRDYTE
jgi:hypothetical protein